jgi:hypothetical protein
MAVLPPLASTSRAREEAVSEWMMSGDRRLTSDGTADLGELIATYRYDGQNRRISRTIEGDPDVTYHDFYNAFLTPCSRHPPGETSRLTSWRSCQSEKMSLKRFLTPCPVRSCQSEKMSLKRFLAPCPV